MPGRIESADDVLTWLAAQHEQIDGLFGEVTRAEGRSRADHFFRLRRLLAVHETAEELVVHPRARWRLPDGDPVSTPRLAEEERAKQMLVALEKMPVDSAEFEAGLARLREAVREHAEAEEREEFPRMREEFGEGALSRMRVAARLAEAVAPTRPHPDAVFAIENAVVGTFTALLDRTRDLIDHPGEDRDDDRDETAGNGTSGQEVGEHGAAPR